MATLSFRSWIGRRFAAAAMSLVVAGGISGAVVAQEQTVLGIAGGPPGGAFFPIAAGMSEVISEHLPHVRLAVEAGGGGPSNAVMIARGDVELAIGDAGVAYEAYNQLGEFEGPEYAALRAFTPGANFGQAFLVRTDSPYETIEDLIGRRIALGPPGTSTAAVGELTLSYYGIELDDIQAEFLTFADATSALADRAVDAIYMTSIHAPGDLHYAALSELTAHTAVRFIVPEPEVLDDMHRDHPYLARVNIPANFYGEGMPDRELDVAGFFAMTYIHADVPEDVVYDMIKTLFENREALGEYHPLAPAYASPDFIEAVPIPFHSGVERYFREQGWIE